MVPQRKSLPQAVPSSICERKRKHANRYPPKSATRLLRWVAEGRDVFAAEHHDEQSALVVSNCRTRGISRRETYVGAAVVVDRGLGHHRVATKSMLARTILLVAFVISGLDRNRLAKSNEGIVSSSRLCRMRPPISLLSSENRCNVLLELGLAEGRSVGLQDCQHLCSCRQLGVATYGNQDELGLSTAEGLEGAPVAEHDLAGLDDKGKLGADVLGLGFGLLDSHCDGLIRLMRRRVENGFGR